MIDTQTISFGRKTASRKVHIDYDEDEKPQMNLCGSWLGELFQVEYTLRVFVKYENWRKRGEGERITLPLRIINTPRLGPSDEPFRVPQNWSPVVRNWEQCLVALP